MHVFFNAKSLSSQSFAESFLCELSVLCIFAFKTLYYFGCGFVVKQLNMNQINFV